MSNFTAEYFKKYKSKNIFGLEKGERPFLYSFWIRKLKRLIPKNAKILEVGCGLGFFLKWLKNKYEVAGIDISYEAISIAKKILEDTNLFVCDAQQLPFKDNIFHCVIAFDVIEHLQSPSEFFKEVARVLKKGGLLVISTPNPESLGARIKPKKPEWKGLPYEQRLEEWFGWRDDTHINIKKIEEWRSLMESNGFKILQEGTDTLWDVPYFKNIPYLIQKLIFIPFTWVFIWLFGFFPWRLGENYICIAKNNNN